jgi:hypothetical protein
MNNGITIGGKKDERSQNGHFVAGKSISAT